MEKKPVHWSKLRHVRFEKPAAGENIIMLYKYTLDTPFQAAVVGILPRRCRSKNGNNTEILPIPKRYDAPLPVSVLLKNDLVSLCKNNAIPRQYHKFYDSLTTTDEISNDEVDPNNSV